MSERTIFPEYNKLNFWGKCKRVIKGIIGLIFTPLVLIIDFFFILIEIGNYIWDAVFNEVIDDE